MANVRPLDAMLRVLHALRWVVVPLQVAIPEASKVLGDEAEFESSKWARRLDQLGRLIVKTALEQRPEFASGS